MHRSRFLWLFLYRPGRSFCRQRSRSLRRSRCPDRRRVLLLRADSPVLSEFHFLRFPVGIGDFKQSLPQAVLKSAFIDHFVLIRQRSLSLTGVPAVLDDHGTGIAAEPIAFLAVIHAIMHGRFTDHFKSFENAREPGTVRPVHPAFSIQDIIFKDSAVFGDLLPPFIYDDFSAEALALIMEPVAAEGAAALPGRFSLSMPFPVQKGSLVDAAVRIPHGSFPGEPVVFQFAHIAIAIYEFHFRTAVRQPLDLCFHVRPPYSEKSVPKSLKKVKKTQKRHYL